MKKTSTELRLIFTQSPCRHNDITCGWLQINTLGILLLKVSSTGIFCFKFFFSSQKLYAVEDVSSVLSVLVYSVQFKLTFEEIALHLAEKIKMSHFPLDKE